MFNDMGELCTEEAGNEGDVSDLILDGLYSNRFRRLDGLTRRSRVRERVHHADVNMQRAIDRAVRDGEHARSASATLAQGHDSIKNQPVITADG